MTFNPHTSNIYRALGAFIGLAVGDALGTTLEFEARDARSPVYDMMGGGPFDLKPGEWTDDTSMALCLAGSLTACDGLDLPERFCRWYQAGENSCTSRCFDVGTTTRQLYGPMLIWKLFPSTNIKIIQLAPADDRKQFRETKIPTYNITRMT